MIEPRPGLTPRSERPPFGIPQWKRTLTPLARLFAARFRRQFDDRSRTSGSLLQSAQKCVNRQQLEELLGRPLYAMLGERYGTSKCMAGQVSRPDVVEVYERDGCMIEAWFKDGALMTMVGFAFPTDWEFLSGATESNVPCHS